MPATAVTVVRPTTAGVADPTLVATDVVNGNSVPNTNGLVLVLNNTDASSHTVTFTTPSVHSGYAVADLTVTLTATTKRNFSNFPPEAFGRTLEFISNSTTVTVGAISAG